MDIKFYEYIEGEPTDIFMALTNPRSIELWSSLPADMSAEEGYEFSIFDGDIVGKNLKVIENQLIEQEWYFDDDNAAPSIVTIKLHLAGDDSYPRRRRRHWRKMLLLV